MVQAAGEKPIVTLTGITGYIGSHTCLQFLQDGGFSVRGTVRDKTDEKKIAPIREAFGDLFNQLELVEADLMDEQSLINAIAGSTYVVHLASPFFFSSDEAQLIPPAINGTTAVMKACQAASVRRCVVTSSGLACTTPLQAEMPADKTFNESHWSNPDREGGMVPYPKSKVLAEKAAWDFVAALPANQKFELVTVLPTFVMGPPLRKEFCTSANWCKNLMEGRIKPIPSLRKCVCDVRDVAKAHLLAIKNPIAAGRRFIICHSSPSFIDYAAPIAEKYRPLGWPISEALAPVDPDADFALFDNSASKELGIEYTDFNQTMVDMADKMVLLGSAVKPEPKPESPRQREEENKGCRPRGEEQKGCCGSEEQKGGCCSKKPAQ